MKEKSDWKNSKYIGLWILGVFIILQVCLQIRKNHIQKRMRLHKAFATAMTTSCNKNFRSSNPTVYYKFSFRKIMYSGSISFNPDITGDICEGYYFKVTFDSTDPSHNYMYVDSPVIVK